MKRFAMFWLGAVAFGSYFAWVLLTWKARELYGRLRRSKP